MSVLRLVLVSGFVAVLTCLLALGTGGDASAGGPQLTGPFVEDYAVTDLGQIEGLPPDYGGITFSPVSGLLLIGGNANEDDATIYLVPVSRDVMGHITGFNELIDFVDAPYIDGGLAIGPGGVVFYSRYNPPMAEFGQILTSVPASAGVLASKVVDLTSLGVEETLGGLNFVPNGFPKAGALKVTSYEDGDWYEIGLAPAGDGTFDATSASNRVDLPSGSEGFVFLQPGLAGFGGGAHVLINNYDDSSITAYDLNGDGDPIADTQQEFLTGISGPAGLAFDPISGDLIISDYDEDRLYRVTGFPAPPPLIRGDNNCDGAINALDALTGLQYVAGQTPVQEIGCYQLGEPALQVVPLGDSSGGGIGPAGEIPLFGDIDCDGDVDAVDSLVILKFVAGLPLGLPQFCEPLGP